MAMVYMASLASNRSLKIMVVRNLATSTIRVVVDHNHRIRAMASLVVTGEDASNVENLVTLNLHVQTNLVQNQLI